MQQLRGIAAVFTCSLEQHISPGCTITALNIQWNLKSCDSEFCMIPALASTPSSSLTGKTFLFAVVAGMRKALQKLCLWDQSCPALHSPRLPLLPSDLKELAPCSEYKLLEKQIRPLPASEQGLAESLLNIISRRVSLL